MIRPPVKHLIICLKGMAMGCADIVPGVSGGTIALISGIYEKLIRSLNSFNATAIKILKNKGIAAAWRAVNGNFLITLFAGIAFSIITLSKGIMYLLSEYPVLLWAFFFGLIAASILFVGKQISRWSLPAVIALSAGTFIAYYISIAAPMAAPESSLFLFLSGFTAIIAMILPGISGAFILVLLGAYETVIGIVNRFREGLVTTNWQQVAATSGDIAIFISGAALGLLCFSGILTWMFKNHKNITLALLTGFMAGSLNKVWPWKETLTWRTNSHGVSVPVLQENINPFSYAEDAQLLWAITLAAIGFSLIFLLEKLSAKKH